MAMLEDVGGGLMMQFIVQAVNGPLQSVASDPITVTTPAAEEAGTASPTEELAPLAAVGAKGNGNGSPTNGSGVVANCVTQLATSWDSENFGPRHHRMARAFCCGGWSGWKLSHVIFAVHIEDMAVI